LRVSCDSGRDRGAGFFGAHEHAFHGAFFNRRDLSGQGRGRRHLSPKRLAARFHQRNAKSGDGNQRAQLHSHRHSLANCSTV
jgi:hypothetical protein